MLKRPHQTEVRGGAAEPEHTAQAGEDGGNVPADEMEGVSAAPRPAPVAPRLFQQGDNGFDAHAAKAG